MTEDEELALALAMSVEGTEPSAVPSTATPGTDARAVEPGAAFSANSVHCCAPVLLLSLQKATAKQEDLALAAAM